MTAPVPSLICLLRRETKDGCARISSADDKSVGARVGVGTFALEFNQNAPWFGMLLSGSTGGFVLFGYTRVRRWPETKLCLNRVDFSILRRHCLVVHSQTRQRGCLMTIIGYARVSTTDQDLSIQETALKAAGCEVIRAEKRSGTTTEGRAELRTVLDFLRKGDVLMVTRIDRLARSIGDLQDIVRAVKARGASLKATEQPIDTGTAAGKCFLDTLGVFAEFETNLRRERQLEGIAKAKAAGVYKGRPASIDAAQVRELKAQGHGATAIAKALNIGRASVYRVLDGP
jgi:DNA invertase Pin-like site-specific DNA recombinase